MPPRALIKVAGALAILRLNNVTNAAAAIHIFFMTEAIAVILHTHKSLMAAACAVYFIMTSAAAILWLNSMANAAAV